MENKTSKKIKFLLLAILLLFLVPSAGDFADGFSAGWNSAREGAESGLRVGDLERRLHFFTRIEPTAPGTALRSFADGTVFTASYASGGLSVPASTGAGWIEVVMAMLSIVMVSAGVIFLVQLIRFAVRFPRRRLMAHQNIASLRWIAGSLGVLGLAEYGMEVVQFVGLRRHVALPGYDIALDTPSPVLIIALILLATAEILKLAGRLQDEQDLTI